MKSILIQTYLVVLPIVLGYIVWLLKQQKKSRDANSKGTMLLLRVQLIEYHAKYTRIGEIPSYAYQNFCEMYDAYHALGGIGRIGLRKPESEQSRLLHRRRLPELERRHLWARWIGNMFFLHQSLPECYHF